MLLAQHLATLLTAGVSLLEALRVVQSEARTRRLRRLFDQISVKVNSGTTFAGALEAQGGAFDPLFVSLVRVGESSGTLEQNLQYLADELEKRISLRNKVRSALLYPIIVLSMTAVFGAVLMLFVLPRIVPLFGALKVQLPWATRVLLRIAQFSRGAGWLVVGGAVSAAVIARLSLRMPAIRQRWHRICLALPVVGRVVRSINLADFCRTLGTLLKSGVPLLEALDITAGTLRNVAYQRELERLHESVASGTSLAAAIMLHSQRVFFPPITLSLIRVGESSGKLDGSLLYLNRFYEREVNYLMKDLTVLLEPALLLLIGLVVAFVVGAIVTPIYQISGSLRVR